MFSCFWRKILAVTLSFCMLFILSVNSPVTAKSNWYKVLRNDDAVTQIMVEENDTEVIATMDKTTNEIKLEATDKTGKKSTYDAELEQLKTNEDGEIYFEGKVTNEETQEVLKLNDENYNIINKNEDIQPSFVWAAPLVLALEAAVEALLLASAVIVVGGATYVLATELSDHLSKNKKYDYFAAYIYYFKKEKTSKVVIGPGISKNEAQSRLLANADVFSRSKILASGLFAKVTRGPEIHGPYPDFLYHYHGQLPTESGRYQETAAHSFYLGR